MPTQGNIEAVETIPLEQHDFNSEYRTMVLSVTAPNRKPYNYTKKYPDHEVNITFSGVIALDLLQQVRVTCSNFHNFALYSL